MKCTHRLLNKVLLLCLLFLLPLHLVANPITYLDVFKYHSFIQKKPCDYLRDLQDMADEDNEIPSQLSEEQRCFLEEPFPFPTFDEWMGFFQDFIDCDENTYTQEEFETIKNLFVFLAKQAKFLLTEEEYRQLDRDIQELQADDDYYLQDLIYDQNEGFFLEQSCFSYPQPYLFSPFVYHVGLWKDFKKIPRKVKNFFKRNGKNVALTLATVATVGVVAYITGGTGVSLALGSGSSAGLVSLKSLFDAVKPQEPAPPYIPKNLPLVQEALTLGGLPSCLDEVRSTCSSSAHHLFYETQGLEAASAHLHLDHFFATNLSSLYLPEEMLRSSFPLEVKGSYALLHHNPKEAVEYFKEALTLSHAPSVYLSKAYAEYLCGNPVEALRDFQIFRHLEPFQETTSLPLKGNYLEFAQEFARGFPQGSIESGKYFCLFTKELLFHPIQTLQILRDSWEMLSSLALSKEWKQLRETLAPEICSLAENWSELSFKERGKQAGYLLGKYSTDFFLPSALHKGTLQSFQGGKKLLAIFKDLQKAEKIAVVESAAAFSSPAKVAQVLESNRQLLILGESLDLSSKEMAMLYEMGALESTIQEVYINAERFPWAAESLLKTKQAEEFLKPYQKKYISEAQARELIHQAGLKTFPRPKGIPENYKIKITNNGGGMEYRDPTNTYFSVRVMPGKPHSPFPYQRKPYVIEKVDGQALDKFGNKVKSSDPEAHILLEEYRYRGQQHAK